MILPPQQRYWSTQPLDKPLHRNFFRIISRTHRQPDILSVLPGEWPELGVNVNYLISSHGMRGGGIILRFGDEKLTSPEIPELYLDIQEPDASGLVRTTFVKGEENPAAQKTIANIKATAEIGNDRVGVVCHSRNQDQFNKMKKQAETGRCLFCDLKKMRETAVKENTYWLIKPNDWPYRYHSIHLIFVHKEGHSENNDPRIISSLAWEETGLLLQWAIRKYNIAGGALVMRFLDYRLSGCTMRHLHWQLQVPDGTGPARAWFYKP